MTSEERTIFTDVYRYTEKYLSLPVNDRYEFFKHAVDEAAAINRRHNNKLCSGLTTAVYNYICEVKGK